MSEIKAYTRKRTTIDLGQHYMGYVRITDTVSYNIPTNIPRIHRSYALNDAKYLKKTIRMTNHT